MPLRDDLQRALRSGLRKHRVPGASLAVLRNGRVTEVAAGVINVETGVKTTVDTVFQIGSITKVFTASLVMQLVDEGRIDLDAPLREYLPAFRVADAETRRAVTPRHLLSHTSGIDGDYFVDSGRGDDSIERLAAMGSLLPSLFEPGAHMSYCNFGFALAGLLIERATGQSFDACMRERLFDPLGMQHALTLPEDTLRYRAAIGHVPHPERPRESVLTPLIYLSHGQKAAGATPTMSVGDLLRFVRLHLDRGKTPEGRRLLRAGSVGAMQKRQVRLPRHSPRAVRGWGLGWFLCDWKGTRVIGHDGGTVGQYAFLRVFPARGVAVALLSNGGDAAGLYESVFCDVAQRVAGVREPAAPEPDPGFEPDPDRYVGCYRNISSELEIAAGDGGLRLSQRDRSGLSAGAELRDVPLAFVDRHTAVLRSGRPVIDRLRIGFSEFEDGRPRFAGSGFRLLPRVD